MTRGRWLDRLPAGGLGGASAWLSLLLALPGCGGDDEPSVPAGVRVEPFVEGGPWDQPLRDCLAVGGADFEPCDFTTLPPLARELGTPTADDLAERLLVSEPWMGERLLAVLEAAPDSLTWAASVTGIVVGAGIAPSFLSVRTGAIYLDARHLAITEEEWRQASGGADRRGVHADELLFVATWAYDVPAQAEGFDALLPRAAAVMYHELAHALDRFPAAALAAADAGATPREFADARHADSASGRLPDTHPLQASRLFDLTRVTVDDDPPTADQLAFTGAQAAAELQGDAATDFYAYFDPQEDVALLVEEFQLARHLGVPREVYVEDREGGLVWGQRGRIGEPAVKARLRWVLQELLPSGSREALEAVDRLPAPSPVTEVRP